MYEDKQRNYLYIRNRILLLSQQLVPPVSLDTVTVNKVNSNFPPLTVTQCRKVIGKDANIILSIFTFLGIYKQKLPYLNITLL